MYSVSFSLSLTLYYGSLNVLQSQINEVIHRGFNFQPRIPQNDILKILKISDSGIVSGVE